ERGQREDDARGDGLAGVAGGLDDVVLKNAGAAKGAQDRDGKDRDGDAGGYRKSRAQADIDGDRAEQDAEGRSQRKRTKGKLRGAECSGSPAAESRAQGGPRLPLCSG